MQRPDRSPGLDQRQRGHAAGGRRQSRRDREERRDHRMHATGSDGPRRRGRSEARRGGPEMTAILVTRPRGSANPLVDELQRRGYRVYEVPTVEIESVPFDSYRLDDYDWIVVTSPRGVEEIATIPAGARFAAGGPTPANALRRPEVEPALIAPGGRPSSIGQALPQLER